MSPETSESASPKDPAQDAKIQQEQRRIDALDHKVDSRVDTSREGDPVKAKEENERLTQTYIGRVNTLQGKIRDLRRKIDVQKDMRAPHWQQLERACNDVNGELLAKLTAIDENTVAIHRDEFQKSVDAFLRTLQKAETLVNAGKDKRESVESISIENVFKRWGIRDTDRARGLARAATERYGEETVRSMDVKVYLLERLQTMGLLERALPDAKDLPPVTLVKPFLAQQLAAGTIDAVFLSDIEGAVRGASYSADEHLRAKQKEYHDLLSLEQAIIKDMGGSTRHGADDVSIKLHMDRLRKTRDDISAKKQELAQVGAQATILSLVTLDIDASVARNSGHIEESNRLLARAWEQHGDGLRAFDPDLAARSEQAKKDLLRGEQVRPAERALLEGKHVDALKLGVRAQRELEGEGKAVDILSTLRTKKRFISPEFSKKECSFGIEKFIDERDSKGRLVIRDAQNRIKSAPSLRTVTLNDGTRIEGVRVDEASVKAKLEATPPGSVAILRRQLRPAMIGKSYLVKPERPGEDTMDSKTNERQRELLSSDTLEGDDIIFARIDGDALFIDNQPTRSIAELERSHKDASRDVLRGMEHDPAFAKVHSLAVNFQRPLQQLQQMFEAGIDRNAKRTQEFVSEARRQASNALIMITEINAKNAIQEAKAHLKLLEGLRTTLLPEGIDGEIRQRIEAIQSFIAMIESPQTLKLLRDIQSEAFNPDTFWNSVVKWGPIIAAAVACAALMVLCPPAGGMLGAALAMAGTGLVVGQVTKEVLWAGNALSGNAFSGDNVVSGAAFGEYLRDQKVTLPDGTQRSMDMLGDVLKPYAQEFLIGAVINFGAMGVGGGAGKLSTMLFAKVSKEVTSQSAAAALARQVLHIRHAFEGLPGAAAKSTARQLIEQSLFATGDTILQEELSEIDGSLGHAYMLFQSLRHGFMSGRHAARMKAGGEFLEGKVKSSEITKTGGSVTLSAEADTPAFRETLARECTADGWKIEVGAGGLKLTAPDGRSEYRVFFEYQKPGNTSVLPSSKNAGTPNPSLPNNIQKEAIATAFNELFDTAVRQHDFAKSREMLRDIQRSLETQPKGRDQIDGCIQRYEEASGRLRGRIQIPLKELEPRHGSDPHFRQFEQEVERYAQELQNQKYALIVQTGGPEITQAWDVLRAEHAELFSILRMKKWSPTNVDEQKLKYTGGAFKPRPFSGEPEITVYPGDREHNTQLLTTRKESVKIVAKMLGVPPERITPELLGTFIFLHEVGHSKDYTENYLHASSDPASAWEKRRAAEMATLPLPGGDPAQMQLLRQSGELKQRLEANPGILEKFYSIDELIAAHERAYRALPSEKYADEFAADILKRHMKDGFLDKPIEATGMERGLSLASDAGKNPLKPAQLKEFLKQNTIDNTTRLRFDIETVRRASEADLDGQIAKFNQEHPEGVPLQKFKVMRRTERGVITFNEQGRIEFVGINKENAREVLSRVKQSCDRGSQVSGYEVRQECVRRDPNIPTHEAYTYGKVPQETKLAMKKYVADPNNWVPEKRAFHEQLFGDMMKSVQENSERMANSKGMGKEHIVVMLRGNTAAGKSSTLRNAESPRLRDLNIDPKSAINPDDVKSAIRRQEKVGEDHTISHNQSHSEGSMLAERVIEKSFEQNLNMVVIDKRFASADDVAEVTRVAKQKGYKVIMVDVDAELQTSIDRVHGNKEKGIKGRDPNGDAPIVPKNVIEEGYRDVVKHRKEVMDMVDEYYLYKTDTSADTLPLVAQKADGKVTIHNQDLFERTTHDPSQEAREALFNERKMVQ